MDEKEIIARMSETVIQQPTIFKIELANPSQRDQFLIKIGLKKKYIRFSLKPLVLGKLIQISSLLTKIEYKKYNSKDNNGLHVEGIRLVEDHGETLARIVAIALCSGKYPSTKFVQFIIDNLSTPELLRAADIIIYRMELTSFLSSIITLTGINILKSEVSPQEAAELIAGQTAPPIGLLAAL